MRAVLDPNVLISALISSRGAPAWVLRAWIDGHYDLIVSPALLEELERALGYPKLARYVSPADAGAFVALLSESAVVVPNPPDEPPVRSPDPGDDYLLALASTREALLVTGDRELLGLAASGLPLLTAGEFLARLDV